MVPNKISAMAAIVCVAGAVAAACTSYPQDLDAVPVFATTSPLPQAQVGIAYSTTLKVRYGTPTEWAVVTDTLPAGLDLGFRNGIISGTPTAAGTVTFTIRVTDVDDEGDTRPFTLTVAP
jgi:hypothetical protein